MADRRDFLAMVCREAVDRVAADRAIESTAALQDRVAGLPTPRGFAESLARPGVRVIAEVKRASPSRGHMTDIPDPAGLASAYVRGGAAAVSVLTEPAHFGGSLDDLRAVAATVDAPVLRKDFVVDAHQLWQARDAGAAAALLIVAALDDEPLTDLMVAAHDAGLDTLVETHSAEEVRRAVACHDAAATGRTLVLGVNARDLVTLQVDRDHIARVRAEVDLPTGALLVAESGVRGPEDVRAYAAVDADAVLVGEHVATHDDPEQAVRELATAVPTSSQT